MDDRRCLLAVHAHPDDEASKGAGTVRKYHDRGVHCVLVCCTGGEEGEILNPALDRDDVRERITEVRAQELAAAAEIIGYDEVVMLGYRDSGMPESEANARQDNFANAPLDEAAGKLVGIIRRTRPQVVLTYGEDQRGYPHPDHLRVHDVTKEAIEAAADPTRYAEAGPPWQVQKVYYATWSRARITAMHEKFLELGLESPYDERWFSRPNQDDKITTKVDVSEYGGVRRDALRAHATQVDPTSRFWFGLPDDVLDTVYPHEDWVLASSEVETNVPEDDLFAGL
jgi:mycothiol S-conjugate amidase